MDSISLVIPTWVLILRRGIEGHGKGLETREGGSGNRGGDWELGKEDWGQYAGGLGVLWTRKGRLELNDGGRGSVEADYG